MHDILAYGWMTEKSKLALIGGIMINIDGEGTDMFIPLSFEVVTNKGQDTKDVFEETFGEEAQAKFLKQHPPQENKVVSK